MSRVAIVQMNSSHNVGENLQKLNVFFKQAQKGGAELLVLPENFAFMGMQAGDKLFVAEEFVEGVIQRTVSQLAKLHSIWVIAGSLFLQHSKARVKASSLVYNHNGENIARYDKIHLFDAQVSDKELHHESMTIAPGNKTAVVDTPVCRIGLSICYDLRFPELYRKLVLEGAELFTVPSAFTAITGAAHWEVLIRARAIENLCYVLAPNQGGVHTNGRSTHGHSMIVDPWGKIINEQPEGEGVIFADIDLQRLQQLRKEFPCNEHHILK